MSQKEREQLTAEFNILSSLRHPNIVAYYHREHLKASQDLYLYMEYCGGGDLSMVIKNLKKSNKFAEEDFVWRIFSQLVTALYRCHYGADAPEVGSNILSVASSPKQSSGLKGKQGQVTILHRDLKPENIFLGSDNSVKLGDFGLSKLMRSHDFASTYVGTPFYMSPEICAAERYTLRSDIWAVGCIMYELCQKEPPFNARTHIQLIQKIRDGRHAPLPDIYSPELKKVIGSCLRVNPDSRPDTTALVNLPVVRLMRKEKELVDAGKAVRKREESVAQKANDLEKQLQAANIDIDNRVRREWEVKARLEIDRQVAMELDRLRKRFEFEVQERVAAASSESSAATSGGSNSASDGTDFSPATELTQMSLESPTNEANKPLPVKKGTRTPFSRSRTVVDSPMDIQMAEPSPMAIASLSLSPRRRSSGKGTNIFADAEHQKSRWDAVSVSDDEEDVPDLPSPTRPRNAVRATGALRHHFPLLRQNTTSVTQNGNGQQHHTAPLFPPSSHPSRLPTAASSPASQQQQDVIKSKSPRRLSKVTSSTNLAADAGGGSPTRSRKQQQLPLKSNACTGGGGGEGMYKAVMQRNMGGRTLIELAQARAGGRTSDAAMENENNLMKPHADHGRDAPAVWDPEKDEMPSPFLVRGRKPIRNLR